MKLNRNNFQKLNINKSNKSLESDFFSFPVCFFMRVLGLSVIVNILIKFSTSKQSNKKGGCIN